MVPVKLPPKQVGCVSSLSRHNGFNEAGKCWSAMVSYIDIFFEGESGADSDSDEEADGGEEKIAVESVSQ